MQMLYSPNELKEFFFKVNYILYSLQNQLVALNLEKNDFLTYLINNKLKH